MKQLSRNALRLLPLLGGLAATVHAQGSDLLIVDDQQTQDQILVARDVDGDLLYSTANELGSVYALIGDWKTTAEYRSEAGIPVVYWYDQKLTTGTPSNGLGAIWRGADGNHDGLLNGAEVTLFYDFGTLEGKMGGDGLALTADGAVWFAGGTVANVSEQDKGLFRSKDQNADGDAMDLGETVQLIDGLAGLFTVESDSGPVGMDAAGFRRMAEDGNGVIVYEDFADEAAFRFEDTNSDGDLLDAGEARLYLNASGKNPALPQNPDWAGGIQRSLKITNPAGGFFYGRLSHVATRVEGGVTASYFGCDSSNTSAFKQNTAGEYLNGLVYRGVDLSLDGDINDAGEVQLYYDGSFTSYVFFEIGKVVGLDAGSDGIYVGDYNGANVIHRMEDTSSDGDANDVGEQLNKAWDTATFVGSPPLLVQPFVNDIAVAPPGTYDFGFEISGTACSFYGPLPKIGYSGHANIGTSNFTCKVSGGPPFGVGILFIGGSTTLWLGFPLPFELTPFNLPGCFLYQDLLLKFVVLIGPTGNGQKTLPVSNDISLVGLKFPLQWAVVDAAGSGALGLSDLGQVTIQP